MREIIIDIFAGVGEASNKHKVGSRVTMHDREVKVTPMLAVGYDIQIMQNAIYRYFFCFFSKILTFPDELTQQGLPKMSTIF